MPLRTDEWPEGKPVSRAFFRQSVWRKAIEDAKVPYIRFHIATRGSHVSWLLAGGADIATVMGRVGHSQFTITQRYMGVWTTPTNAH